MSDNKINGGIMITLRRLSFLIDPPNPEEYVLPRTKFDVTTLEDIKTVHDSMGNFTMPPKMLSFLIKLSIKKKRLDFADFFIECMEKIYRFDEEIALIAKEWRNKLKQEHQTNVYKDVIGKSVNNNNINLTQRKGNFPLSRTISSNDTLCHSCQKMEASIIFYPCRCIIFCIQCAKKHDLKCIRCQEPILAIVNKYDLS